MLRLAARYVLDHSKQLGRVRCQAPKMCYSTMHQAEGQSQVASNDIREEIRNERNLFLGQKITRKEKMKFLIKTLFDLEDSKDAIYGTLDAWLAWEQDFPIAALKNVLLALEKDQQWHRVVQVVKWMLSKGQGNTMGTYPQLIRALDMDHRAEEAHNIWMKKIGNNLHSVPWQACHLMISVYHRNNMLERLVKLFRSLEAFGRIPPEKSIVQKVADAYELLGLVDDKERLLVKYANLLSKTREDSKTKSNKVKSRRKETSSGSRSSLAIDVKA